jgi:hypothetical protein
MAKRIKYDGEDRLSVARAVLRTVGLFSDADPHVWPQVEKDGTAEECEDLVRELADEAQRRSLRWNGREHAIVMEALDDEFLADDFMRMIKGEQAMAFEPGGPRTDVCRNCGAPRNP